MNSVNLVGRLGRDPETKQTTQSQVCKFSIAVDSQDKQTDWIDIEAWGKTAELVAKYFSKGRQIGISGRLKLDTWESEGKRKSKLKVVAEKIHFTDSKPSEQPTTQQQNYPVANSGNNNSNMNLDDIPF